MANEPLSPVSHLAAILAQQPSLKAHRIPVYAGRKSQAKNTTPPRILIYPKRGAFLPATSKPDSLCDIDEQLVADCWGTTLDAAWAMRGWLIQALNSQGEDRGDGGAGYWWDLIGSDWEIAADAGTEGEVVSVLFSAKFTVPAVAYDDGHLGVWPTGEIDSVAQDITEAP